MKTKKLLLGLGACVLVAGATATIGYGSQGFKNWNLETWFQTTPEDEEPNEDNGMIVDGEVQTEKNAYFSSMPGNVMFRSLSVNQAMTINVTVLPENAYNKTLKWTLGGVDISANPNQSGWNITISEDSHSISIKPTAAFTTTKTLTATTTDGSNISQSCTLDYLGRVVSNTTQYIDDYSNDIYKLSSEKDLGGVLTTIFTGIGSKTNRVSGGSINGNIKFKSISLSSQGIQEFVIAENSEGFEIADGNFGTYLFDDIDPLGDLYLYIGEDLTFTISYELIYNNTTYSTGTCTYTVCLNETNLASGLRVTSLGFSTNNVQY